MNGKIAKHIRSILGFDTNTMRGTNLYRTTGEKRVLVNGHRGGYKAAKRAWKGMSHKARGKSHRDAQKIVHTA